MDEHVENDDPWAVLGVGHDATSDEIRGAYLDCVRRNPPEGNPEAFERIRDAYEAISDPRRRIERLLLADDPERPLAALLDDLPAERRFVGLGPWLAVIAKGK